MSTLRRPGRPRGAGKQRRPPEAAAYAEIRKKIGTQADVSRSLGISLTTLARRETGHAPITTEMRLALEALVATIET
jgi:hypothetical protein